MKKTIQMEELVCPMCAAKIENALKALPGVTAATVLYNAAKAKVEFDEQTISAEKLVRCITDLGYVVLS